MTTRVFTVEVTGCKDCPYSRRVSRKFAFCNKAGMEGRAGEIFEENQNAITESCPMYQHSFVKDEKK